MKILHVTHDMDPARGGPPAIVARLAAAQIALGNEVRVFSGAEPSRASRTAASLLGIPGIGRVTFVSAQIPMTVRQAFFPTSWYQTLRDEVARADFVHIHEVWPLVGLKAAQASHRLGKPYSISPQGTINTWSFQQRGTKKRLALALGYRAALNRASFLQMLNADEALQAGALKLTAPTRELANGIFVEEVDPLPERGTFRATVPGLGDSPFVLFLSRLHFKKGVDILAATFAQLASRDERVHLVVAGPDDGERAAAEATLTAAGLAQRVHFVGPVYGKARFAALHDADIFCLPSRMEGFSIAILEALVCGTPVVITRACNFPQVQDAGAGEVVQGLDPHDIANALHRLLGDPERRRRAGEAGSQLVRSNYTWPVIAERSIDLYREFTASSAT
jgi:glycosyltransferase involved in cell wall biosynthesis